MKTKFKLASVFSVVISAILAMAYPLTTFANHGEIEQRECEEIIQGAEKAMFSGTLNPSLFPMLLDYVPTACPHKSYGPNIEEACVGTLPGVSLQEIPPNEEWNGVDFDYEILQYFLTDENYHACKDIFEDPLFKDKILNIEPIPDSRIDHYRWQAISRRVYFEVNSDKQPTALRQFDDIQLRIFSVFDYISSWNYCGNPKWVPIVAGGYGRVLGHFDKSSRRITLFDGFCTSKDIYGLTISQLTATHRAFLIAAHELGHVIDELSRPKDIQLRWKQQEARATFFASYIVQCGARLFRLMGDWYMEIASTNPITTDADRDFLKCQTLKWQEMEVFIADIRNKIDIKSGYVPEKWGSIQACISYYE